MRTIAEDSKYSSILETFAEEYMGIVSVDLEHGMAEILKFTESEDAEGKKLSWDRLLESYADLWVYSEDRHIVCGLTLEKLEECGGYDTVFPIELRCTCSDKIYNWVRISAAPVAGERRKLLILAKIINEDRLMRRIIDLFVYRNFDYFVLVDAKNNSYIMFNGKAGLTLPPVNGDDYEAEVRRYNEQYVTPKEAEDTTANMSIAHVQSVLEEHDTYSFTVGAVNDKNEYRRTRIQFTYYDKSAGLIMLTRMDVTKLYLDELEKEKRLVAALEAAQCDPMTGLYNKKAIYELVDSTLSGGYCSQAALLFIDIDNFKLVNDTLGHQIGDDFLHHVGATLKKMVGKGGMAGRIGGDEFLLFLPVNQSLSAVEEYAEEICLVFKSKSELSEINLPVSCSVGISLYPQDGTEAEKLLFKADQALYDAKRFGKCQYAFYSVGSDTDRGHRKRMKVNRS